MDQDEDGYRGPATLTVGSTELTVTVALGGHFEPIDGRYHWYGRIQQDERLSTLLGARKGKATIRTPHGETEGTLTDPDPWGRYRISGTTRPPFPVPTTLADVEHP